MSTITKYIRHMDRFVCFNKRLIHADMAETIFPKKLIHGAGFIITSVDENGALLLKTYGTSESLRIGPRLDDAETMMENFGFSGDTTLAYVSDGFDTLVFSTNIDHKDVARFSRTKESLSAGFVKLIVNDGKIDIELFGKSESLGIEANESHYSCIYDALGIFPEYFY